MVQQFDERGFPIGHREVDQVRTNKEPIAQIDDGLVNVRRVVGNDEDGFPISVKVPTKQSVKMLDPAGSELDIALQNHRVRLPVSLEKYGRAHLQSRLREGWLLKDFCPLDPSPAGKPMAGPIKGEPKEPCKVPPNAERDPEWHGCVHYQRIKERRRAASAEDMRKRKARVKTPTEKQIEQYQDMNQQLLERMTVAIETRRDDFRSGRSEPELKDA